MLALLKNEWAIRFVILLAGLGLGFKLRDKPQRPAEPAVQAQKQNQDCKVKVVKVTNPDGTTQESVEISAKSDQQQEQKSANSSFPKYGIAAYHDSSFGARYRLLDNVSAVLIYDSKNNHKAGVEIQF